MEDILHILFKYWYIIGIIGYYLYTGIKNAQKVNADRPKIPDNQPDIKPEAKKRAQVERRHPTSVPIPQASKTVPAPSRPAPKKEKSFEEAMGEIFGQYENKQGEGYGDARPFSYNVEEAQPIAEPEKGYKFGDSLVGNIGKAPKSMALRGEIGSEDESPTRRRLAFRPKDAIKYSIMLERKYFDV